MRRGWCEDLFISANNHSRFAAIIHSSSVPLSRSFQCHFVLLLSFPTDERQQQRPLLPLSKHMFCVHSIRPLSCVRNIARRHSFFFHRKSNRRTSATKYRRKMKQNCRFINAIKICFKLTAMWMRQQRNEIEIVVRVSRFVGFICVLRTISSDDERPVYLHISSSQRRWVIFVLINRFFFLLFHFIFIFCVLFSFCTRLVFFVWQFLERACSKFMCDEETI